MTGARLRAQDLLVLLLAEYHALTKEDLPYHRDKLHAFLFERRDQFPQLLGRLVFDTRGWNPVSDSVEAALDALQMRGLAGKPNPNYNEITIKDELLGEAERLRCEHGDLLPDVEALAGELRDECAAWAA